MDLKEPFKKIACYVNWPNARHRFRVGSVAIMMKLCESIFALNVHFSQTHRKPHAIWCVDAIIDF